MNILAVDTSCDDTSIAIIEAKGRKNPRFKVLSNVISSQSLLHAEYGGVYPSLAKREHGKNLPTVFGKAVKEAKNPKIDLISLTVGPGLEPCLWEGINFAAGLAKEKGLPLARVNHIEAHFLANFPALNRKIFPALSLVVSGGHTQLILAKGVGNYAILGETRDDAAGECFDKIARVLGLGYPGGPAIAVEARKFKDSDLKSRIKLPRPMMHHKNYDFSFSGLKTAAIYLVRKMTADGVKLTLSQKREISAEVQQAIIDVLISKTIKAAKEYKVKSIILGGGVAANDELRVQFQSAVKKQKPAIKFLVPSKEMCTDNAAMVGVAGYYAWLRGEAGNAGEIRADANFQMPSRIK